MRLWLFVRTALPTGAGNPLDTDSVPDFQS